MPQSGELVAIDPEVDDIGVAIVLTPNQGELQIELKGNLAAMPRATQNERSPETGDLSLQIAMVAGARNHHYLQLWRLVA